MKKVQQRYNHELNTKLKTWVDIFPKIEYQGSSRLELLQFTAKRMNLHVEYIHSNGIVGEIEERVLTMDLSKEKQK